jgi:L-ribulose-5-phosphate 3-epimerase
MKISRRSFLAGGPAMALLAGGQTQARSKGLRIGVTEWNLRLTGVEAVEAAARLGFDGLQVSLGPKPIDGRLALDDAVTQQQLLTASKIHKIPLDGTCLDILDVNCLKSDKLGLKWVADSIPITRKLGARVILLPFFDKGALITRQEMDYVGDALREIAPAAEKAGVVLGLEDTISAEDNVRVMERAKSPAVLTYYDVGNSAEAGFDVLKEIRWLGKDRICQFHLKDNPHYLGEGKIDFPPIIKAIEDIGFRGFANLETSCPSNSVDDDMLKNLHYVRRLVG